MKKKPSRAEKISQLTLTIKLMKENHALIVGMLQRDISRLEIRLNEARRRTIPMKGARGFESYNFLPGSIISVSINQEEVRSVDIGGFNEVMAGPCTITLTVDGDLVASLQGQAEPRL